MSASAPASVFAPAKINLFLHVGDKRADGYHDIYSLASFADVGDEVSGELADTLTLGLTGPFATPLAGEGEGNLVIRAARALQHWAQAQGHNVDGARLNLHKNLPVASGIGGGSSDAAATLKYLNQLWQLDLSESDLMRLGATLGADVPVCLRGQATLMEGIGEKLTPWPQLPPLPAVLVNPRVSVMTADVFRALSRRSGVRGMNPEKISSPQDAAAWLAHRDNDLAAPAIRIAPIIGDVLQELTATSNCLLSRMSGSGATCFGLYKSAAAATAAAAALAARRPLWWIAPATLR